MKKLEKTHLKSKMLLAIVLPLALACGCMSDQSNSHILASGDSKSQSGDEIVPPRNPDGYSGAVGNVVKFSENEVEITGNDQPLIIKLTDSLHVYAPSPGSLANVKSSAYIGVISKKQTDQSDQAAQVLILPDELRGVNEGSFMLPADKDADGEGRMTNGSASRMTNGATSRMSNGSVAEASMTSLTLQYQGYSRTVNIPQNTPVIEYKLSGRRPNAGDKIFALVKKDDHGILVSSKVLIF